MGHREQKIQHEVPWELGLGSEAIDQITTSERRLRQNRNQQTHETLLKIIPTKCSKMYRW